MTSSASPQSTVLTAIACVLRARALSLDHVAQLLDEFVDVPVLSSLPKAAANGSVRWFDRVYERTLGNDLAQNPLYGIGSSEAVLAKYLLSNAMQEAVEHGHMTIVARIHARHPKRLPVALLPPERPPLPSAAVSFLRIAAEKGNLEMFQWLLAHRTDDLCVPDGCCDGGGSVALPCTTSVASLSCCLKRAYSNAIRHDQLHIAMRRSGSAGDLEKVQWLHTHAIANSFTDRAIDFAAKDGHRHVVQYLLTHRSEGFTDHAVHNAILGGYEEMHELLRGSGIRSPETFEYLGKWAFAAAQAGRLDLVKSIRYCYRQEHKKAALDKAWRAARHGRLQILQWLHDHADELLEPTDWSRSIDFAAENGHLAVIKWLHLNRHEQTLCRPGAMVVAAAYGHLEILQWLHVNRTTERWTTRVMDRAAAYNRLEIVEWLHAHRTEGCSTQTMTEAANMGHLEMVIWLHQHRHEGYAPKKLVEAPLSVLQWLHVNRHEGWTTRVMDRAAMNGDHAMLAFLHEHRTTTEGCCTARAICIPSNGSTKTTLTSLMADKSVPRRVTTATITSSNGWKISS